MTFARTTARDRVDRRVPIKTPRTRAILKSRAPSPPATPLSASPRQVVPSRRSSILARHGQNYIRYYAVIASSCVVRPPLTRFYLLETQMKSATRSANSKPRGA